MDVHLLCLLCVVSVAASEKGDHAVRRVLPHMCMCTCVCVCVCLIVRYLEALTMGRPRPKLGSCATEEKNIVFFILFIA